MDPPDDRALAAWEDEGGRIRSVPGGATRSPTRLHRSVRAIPLDGDLTYLGLTWLKLGDEHDPARELNHAERDRMRTQLRALLHVGEPRAEPR